MTMALAFPVLLLLALADASAAYQFSGGGLKPDLVVMAVVAWSVLAGWKESLVWAVVGGVALGIFSSHPLTPVLPLVLVAVPAAFLGGQVRRYRLAVALLVAPVATLFYDGCSLLLLQLSDVPIGWGLVLQQRVLPTTLLNTIAILLMFPLFYWVRQRTKPDTLWP